MKISISSLSVAYGLTPEALRYYEEKGLLTPERANGKGYRQFTLNDVQLLGFIKSYQRQGFSL
ncbi:MAG: MerR family transcriptional regulator [Clostridia bacterium]|nr:MerR family transcriptional regulator [Clostridia bacterium]